MAHKMDDFLFTHARLSRTFLQRARSLHPQPALEYDVLLNDLFIYKPQSFQFYGANPYGDDITQTCIWIRPASLMKDNKDNLNKEIVQVVGHTSMNWIDAKGKSTGGRYYFINTLGTSREYLLIENKKVSVGVI